VAAVTETVQIAARVEKSVKDALEENAGKHDRTFSAELRRALRTYLATIEEAEAGTAA
jgi:plasmid stability protein